MTVKANTMLSMLFVFAACAPDEAGIKARVVDRSTPTLADVPVDERSITVDMTPLSTSTVTRPSGPWFDALPNTKCAWVYDRLMGKVITERSGRCLVCQSTYGSHGSMQPVVRCP